jgi:hypothetical protein
MLVALALSLQAMAAPTPATDTLVVDTLAVAAATPVTATTAEPAPAVRVADGPSFVLPMPAVPLVARPLPTLAPALPGADAARIGLALPADGAVRRITVPPAVEFSDWYYRRLSIHRALSWAMIPLFIGSYVTGEQLLDKGSDAPTWARRLHPAFAGGSAAVFGVNTVTGVWNLVEGWKVKEGRTRRVLHSVAMTVASAGFVYAGSLGDEARENGRIRDRHRTVALGSMGISTVSWLFMLFGN